MTLAKFKFPLLCSLTWLAAMPGCGTSSKGTATVQSLSGTAAFTSQGEKIWSDYVQETTAAADLQPNCAPVRFAPSEGTPRRGVVFLVHGFSACPQQFFEWASQLKEAGFEVVLPLLPGHGRKRWQADALEHRDLPNETNYWERYGGLAHTLNELAKEAQGDRVIGGLSVGGAVATWASQLTPNVFARQIIMTPFFEMGHERARLALNGVGILRRLHLPAPQGLLERVEGWGPGCEDETTRSGIDAQGHPIEPRAGICTFLGRHVFAAHAFGLEVVEKLGTTQGSVPLTQFVLVENDLAVNNDRTEQAAARLRGRSPANSGDKRSHVNVCYYPEGTNHSLLSKYDSPDEDKFWLPHLLEHATAFVTQGVAFPQQPPLPGTRLPWQGQRYPCSASLGPNADPNFEVTDF